MEGQGMSVSNPGWWALIGAGWVAALGPGAIEGAVRPAVTPLVISSYEVTEDGYVRFDGVTERLRGECSYSGIEWRLGDRDEQRVPTEVIPEKPQLRPDTGEIVLTGWRVYLGGEDIEHTHADVLHECRVGDLKTPWIVRTRFWR